MPLVKSQRFWTRPLIIFAVLQFIFYMFCFWKLYNINMLEGNEDNQGSQWRILLIFACIGAIITSAGPAILRNAAESIRLEEEKNYCYCSVIAPFIVWGLYFLGRAYYYWSLSISKSDIQLMFLAYVFLAPIFTYLLYSIQRDTRGD